MHNHLLPNFEDNNNIDDPIIKAKELEISLFWMDKFRSIVKYYTKHYNNAFNKNEAIINDFLRWGMEKEREINDRIKKERLTMTKEELIEHKRILENINKCKKNDLQL